MEWNPITTEHEESFLLVGCWDQTFYCFDAKGDRRKKISEKHIPCDPISVNFHYSGEYFVMTGSDKKISVYSRDLCYLSNLNNMDDVSFSTKFRPKSQELAITTESGLILVQQLTKKRVLRS